jgi:hypothetical protein
MKHKRTTKHEKTSKYGKVAKHKRQRNLSQAATWSLFVQE